jgi:uncharacterized tellurite resistance protein B-like protein
MSLSLIFSLFANQVSTLTPCLQFDEEGRPIGDAVAKALTSLLVCMSFSDQVFQENEAHAIINILRDEFSLPDETTENLLISAMERAISPDEALWSVATVAKVMTPEQREHLYLLVAGVAKVDNGICYQEDKILKELGSALNIEQEREVSLRKSA